MLMMVKANPLNLIATKFSGYTVKYRINTSGSRMGRGGRMTLLGEVLGGWTGPLGRAGM